MRENGVVCMAGTSEWDSWRIQPNSSGESHFQKPVRMMRVVSCGLCGWSVPANWPRSESDVPTTVGSANQMMISPFGGRVIPVVYPSAMNHYLRAMMFELEDKSHAARIQREVRRFPAWPRISPPAVKPFEMRAFYRNGFRLMGEWQC